MPRKSLRVVADGETPPTPAKPLTVTEAASTGSRRDLLVALRDRIAVTVQSDMTPARDLAALSKRLVDITNEIAAVDAQDKHQEAGADVEDGAFDASAV